MGRYRHAQAGRLLLGRLIRVLAQADSVVDVSDRRSTFDAPKKTPIEALHVKSRRAAYSPTRLSMALFSQPVSFHNGISPTTFESLQR